MEISRLELDRNRDSEAATRVNMKSEGQEVVKVTRGNTFDTRQFIKRVQQYPEIYEWVY